MSIYRENSTLFMNDSDKLNRFDESEIQTIPGYTTSFDLLKMVQESYENDMVIFEELFELDVREAVAESDEAKKDIDNERKETLMEKIIKFIEMIRAKFVSILDAVAKAFEDLHAKVNDKRFKENKQTFISNYDNLKKNFGTREFLKLEKSYGDELIEKAINFNCVDEDFISSLAEKLGKGNKDEVEDDIFKKINILTLNGREIIKKNSKEDVHLFYYFDEVLSDTTTKVNENPFNFYKTDDIISIIEDRKDTKLRTARNNCLKKLRELESSYKKRINISTLREAAVLKNMLDVISMIHQIYARAFKFIIIYNKKLVGQAYALFNAGVKFIGAKGKSKKDVATKEPISDDEFDSETGDINKVEESAFFEGYCPDFSEMSYDEASIYEFLETI